LFRSHRANFWENTVFPKSEAAKSFWPLFECFEKPDLNQDTYRLYFALFAENVKNRHFLSACNSPEFFRLQWRPISRDFLGQNCTYPTRQSPIKWTSPEFGRF
jgi:hypothetical protein